MLKETIYIMNFNRSEGFFNIEISMIDWSNPTSLHSILNVERQNTKLDTKTKDSSKQINE